MSKYLQFEIILMKSILLEIYFFYTPEINENIFNLIKYLLKSFFKLSGGNCCIFF